MKKLLSGCTIGLVLGIAISAGASTAWSTWSQQDKFHYVSGIGNGVILASNLLAQGVKPEGLQFYAKFISTCQQTGAGSIFDVVQTVDRDSVNYDQQIPQVVAMELAKCGGFVP